MKISIVGVAARCKRAGWLCGACIGPVGLPAGWCGAANGRDGLNGLNGRQLGRPSSPPRGYAAASRDWCWWGGSVQIGRFAASTPAKRHRTTVRYSPLQPHPQTSQPADCVSATSLQPHTLNDPRKKDRGSAGEENCVGTTQLSSPRCGNRGKELALSFRRKAGRQRQ